MQFFDVCPTDSWTVNHLFCISQSRVCSEHRECQVNDTDPWNYIFDIVCRDGVFGEANLYGLDGRGIESLCRRDFPHPCRLALGPTQPPVQWETVRFPGGKAARSGIPHTPPSNANVKERVELHLYSPFGPSWPVQSWTLPLFLTSRRYAYLTCSTPFLKK
jgi:hypothetical protein